MSLSLPPKSVIRCDASTTQQVHGQLTSVIAGHPQATTTKQTRGQIFIIEDIPHNLLRERAKGNLPEVQRFRLKGLKVKIL